MAGAGAARAAHGDVRTKCHPHGDPSRNLGWPWNHDVDVATDPREYYPAPAPRRSASLARSGTAPERPHPRLLSMHSIGF